MPVNDTIDLKTAVDAIHARDGRRPDVAMILGSGLGSLADSAANATIIPGSDIPGFPTAGVTGHMGDLLIGELSGKVVAFMRGRFHRYEGHDEDTLTFPVRILAGMGVGRLIVTNAAGSLHAEMKAGSLMRITDHINMTGSNPLLGLRNGSEALPTVDRRPEATGFNAAWGKEADEIARDLGIPLDHGVYLWTLGPSYETPAEIRFFKRIGADAVGMSTVPEVSVASRLGMKVLGFSAITNLGTGLGEAELSHADVLEVGKSIHGKMERLTLAIVAAIPTN